MSDRFGLVVVAAGNGLRMGQSTRKPYLPIGDKPLLVHTLFAFQKIGEISSRVLVVHPEEVERTREILREYQIEGYLLTTGGQLRQESVGAGIERLKGLVDYVLIHDGARPFVSEALIRRVMDAVVKRKAVIPALPVPDTIKRVNREGRILETIDRDHLRAAQTPQAFDLSLLEEVKRKADGLGIEFTDEAAMLEHWGIPVYTVEGDRLNFKITTPIDLMLAEGLIARWETM